MNSTAKQQLGDVQSLKSAPCRIVIAGNKMQRKTFATKMFFLFVFFNRPAACKKKKQQQQKKPIINEDYFERLLHFQHDHRVIGSLIFKSIG